MPRNIQISDDLQSVIDAATAIATSLHHTKLTFDHILSAIFSNSNFYTLLNNYNNIYHEIAIDDLATKVNLNLRNRTDIVSTDPIGYIKPADILVKVFNTTNAQVFFSNKPEIEVVDLFIAMLNESAIVNIDNFIKYLATI